MLLLHPPRPVAAAVAAAPGRGMNERTSPHALRQLWSLDVWNPLRRRRGRFVCLMLFKSSVFAQASGSLSGTVFSHNAGGQYVRNRSIPTDPSSAFQVAVRNALGTLASAWTNLTDSERAQWATYGANVPIVNRLGDPINLSGIAQFIRSNAPRENFMGPTNRVTAAPSDFTLPSVILPTLTAAEQSPGAIDVVGGVQDPVLSATSPILVFCSKPQNASVNFFKGPYRYVGSLTGSPSASLTLPDNIFAGQKLFVQYRRSLADGRLSTPLRDSTVVTV